MTNSSNSTNNVSDHDVSNIVEKLKKEGKTKTYLRADEKIIARVTEGIYREPWAAFRELISNAYDADATEIFINTDYPHFKKIEIKDNGNGMTSYAVARLVRHIGGSSKRDKEGETTGTTAKDDPSKSPKGRFMIGKLGIGLFAVSHLTQHFQIITKTKGAQHRTIAIIRLKTYQDNSDETNGSGEVTLLREECGESEYNNHGTSIYLMDLRPEIISILRDEKRWHFAENDNDEDGQIGSISPPSYHIGRFDKKGEINLPPVLPWKADNNPDEKFKSFFSAATQYSDTTKSTQGLDLDVFDYYLQMFWKLGLSSPLPYFKSHPFNLKKRIDFYKISNQPKGQPEFVDLQAGTIGKELNLSTGGNIQSDFKVIIDGVSLKRPILYAENIIFSKRSPMENPIMLVGQYNPYMSGSQKERAGGRLHIEAAVYWNNVIIPKSNNGVLVQIHGANGTLFDKTFLDYRVSEQTRLRQITAEIFVQEGLDGALNIDRESFNHSHPHYILMREWLHSAIRQLTNKHKEIGKAKNVSRKKEHSDVFVKKILTVWHTERGKDNDPPLAIQSNSSSNKDDFKDNIAEDIGGRVNIVIPANKEKKIEIQRRLSAIIAVLDAYDLLSSMPQKKRAEIVNNIYYAATEDASVSLEIWNNV